MVIECAFGRLNARFGALSQEVGINMEDLPNVLHNFCEVNNEIVWEESAQLALQKVRLCPQSTKRNPAIVPILILKARK